MERLKAILHKYKHAWVFLYAFIYIPWFLYLENHTPQKLYIIHSPLDDYIPFVEFFIVPYLLWFAYMAVVVGYFFLKNKQEFYRLVTFLFTGMTIFLIISTFFPNGLMLRPETFARDNVFTHAVQVLYRADTSTNVFPSIHVFNSIGVCIAVMRSSQFAQRWGIQTASLLLTSSIVASTVFLKQHSIVDVAGGILLAYFIYQLVYVLELGKAPGLYRQPV